MIFIDLRDRWGVIQVAVDPSDGPVGLEVAKAARLEDVLQVTGVIRERPGEAVNPGMPTGGCEVQAVSVAELAGTETPPFVVDEEATASEELALKYRYLDLRRPPLQRRREPVTISCRAASITGGSSRSPSLPSSTSSC